MSKGSSSTLVFFIIVIVLGAILAIGANELQHGFFGANSRWSLDDKSFSETLFPKGKAGKVQKSESIQSPSKPSSAKPISKAVIDKHKDSLERRDRAELDELIDRVGQ